MSKRIAGVILLAMLLVTGVFGAGTNYNLETVAPVRYVYPAASENNPIEGYWYKSSTVTQAYVNYYPTGCAYTFILNCDSANTAVRSGPNFNPARIDFPLWKHHGVVGSYAFSVVDTGTGFNGTDDSLKVLCELRAISATTTADTCDTLFKNTLQKGVLIQQLLDSTDGKSPLEINKTATGVLGFGWVTALRYGSIDLTDESKYYERAKIYALQAGVDAQNSTKVRLALRLYLPYSAAYMQTDYYRHNQLVK